MLELTPELLLTAYRNGIFPMGDEWGRIQWCQPNPRGILLPEEFHLPHGLRRFLKKCEWGIRIDVDFEITMRNCAQREETWITKELIRLYCGLHRQGFAHSLVVCGADGETLGGLYGVHIGGIFFGESMFHRASNASKVALFALMEILQVSDFALLDTQWSTPHLSQFGVKDISAAAYKELLEQALLQRRIFSHPALIDRRAPVSEFCRLSKSYCKQAGKN
ncbi:MAG: leucyl/phenylalanyl-tRNA--protein transferase [Chthoniobacterales bacterium]